ncbi:coiled-coil domain-containing protein [Vibrio metoecus]|uniref:coiled-coil domain-containing protein n=1 Tax=Vibrio metoecus TaxID=1481663 RepID=UPI000BA9CD4F|nr:hypothetical protein [Vibrio metoecus]PAR26845.1 hypothetical protein CGU00_17045 [Vibrio metoecus]PAR62105.1 hypothetical protein CGT90_08545 [Vibrio metoecus]
MTKQRLYHSNFNHMGWKKKKGEKSRAHNLRAIAALVKLYMQSVDITEICDPDLIKNNLLYIPDENGKLKIADPKKGDQYFEEITKKLEEEKKEYISNIDNSYSDSNKAELSDKRAKAKAALKRYSKGSEGNEKVLWDELTEKLGSEEIDTEEEIAKLKNSTDGKIKRFNQKIQRIKELSKYNGLLGVKSRNTEYTIFSKEVLYKIPDDTDLNIKPLDMANFVNKMNQRLYPDFQSTYIVIHADENVDRAHAHCEFSGKNLKTGEMDIQHQLFLNLEKELKKKNKPFPYSGKTYNSLNYDEVKHFGEVYQDFIFEEMNDYLKLKGYDAKLEKRTKEEKKNDFNNFLDKHKPTQNREFTRAKKLQAENKEATEKLTETKEELKEISENVSSNKTKILIQTKIINSQTQELENINNEINQKQGFLQKLNESIKDALVNAYEYAINDLPIYIQNYFNRQKTIKEISKELSMKVENKAIEMQPTEEKKNVIKNNKLKMN